jgi:hypothetical protein
LCIYLVATLTLITSHAYSELTPKRQADYLNGLAVRGKGPHMPTANLKKQSHYRMRHMRRPTKTATADQREANLSARFHPLSVLDIAFINALAHAAAAEADLIDPQLP